MLPHDQIQILAYNRLVRDLVGLSPDAFTANVASGSRCARPPRSGLRGAAIFDVLARPVVDAHREAAPSKSEIPWRASTSRHCSRIYSPRSWGSPIPAPTSERTILKYRNRAIETAQVIEALIGIARAQGGAEAQ